LEDLSKAISNIAAQWANESVSSASSGSYRDLIDGLGHEGLKHGGENCFGADMCPEAGFCTHCGKGNRCCRMFWQEGDPLECKGTTGYTDPNEYQCVVSPAFGSETIPKSLQVDSALDSLCGIGGELQDCKTSAWSEWSECSATCRGFAARSRKLVQPSLHGGALCEDEVLYEYGSCNDDILCVLNSQDCVWSEWSEWGQCTSCSGEQIRNRSISQEPSVGGLPCEAKHSQEVSPCPRPCDNLKYCVWSDWDDSAECSATCGNNATRERTRSLNTFDEPQLGTVVVLVGEECNTTESAFASCLLSSCDSCVPGPDQDAQLSDWSEWSTVDPCAGLCQRNRSIVKNNSDCGQPASGALVETTSCPSECTRRDCVFNDWEEWSSCEGSPQRMRNRTFTPQRSGGDACVGAVSETSWCQEDASDLEDTVTDCTYSPWVSGPCSQTCGSGSKLQYRDIATFAANGGAGCSGPTSRLETCNEGHCPESVKNCKFGEWSEWSGCGGDSLQARRTRSIAASAEGTGKPCIGPVTEAQPCSEEVVDCAFSLWSEWGVCDSTCNGGQRNRVRSISTRAKHGGTPCEGPLLEVAECNEEVQCDPEKDCLLGDWAEWGPCESSGCGQGYTLRNRSVVTMAQPDGVGCAAAMIQSKGCMSYCSNIRDCEWDEWSDWSGCVKPTGCGAGYKARFRNISSLPMSGGKGCVPESKSEVREFDDCGYSCDNPCVDGGWGSWSDWSACSATCGGGGITHRTRDLERHPTACGEFPEGSPEEFEECSATNACPGGQDCEFSDWGAWTPAECESQCTGARTHQRSVKKPPADGGKGCSGSLVESVACVDATCANVSLDCHMSPWSDWSGCSSDCGLGLHSRNRSIIPPSGVSGGYACHAKLEVVEECHNVKACTSTSDCKWSDWSDWSACSFDSGTKSRSRKVQSHKIGTGRECTGSSDEIDTCTTNCTVRPFTCEWSEWTEWSGCSTSCGTRGRITRVRNLTLTEQNSSNVVSSNLYLHEDIESSSKELIMVSFVAIFMVLTVLLVTGRIFMAMSRRGSELQ